MDQVQCPSTPADVISLSEIRSKIEHHRVRKTLVERVLRGFFSFLSPHGNLYFL